MVETKPALLDIRFSGKWKVATVVASNLNGEGIISCGTGCAGVQMS